MTQLLWQVHLGFALESSGWGVSGAQPALYVPVTKCDFKDSPKFYYDDAYRSVYAKDFGAYAATIDGDWSFDCDAYVDTLPLMLGCAMLGDGDIVTTVNLSALKVGWTTGTVNAHTFLVGNPASMTLWEYNGYSERSYAGARVEEVGVKYSPDGSLSTSYKGKSMASVLVNGSYTPVVGTNAPLLGWQATFYLNGAQNMRLIDANLTFKRGSEVLHTQAGTQSPTNIYVFPLEVDGKMTLDFVDEAEYNIFRNNTQNQTWDILFVSSSNNALRFTIPNPIFTSYSVDKGKEYLTAAIDFRGIYSASQSTNVKMVVYNGQSTKY